MSNFAIISANKITDEDIFEALLVGEISIICPHCKLTELFPLEDDTIPCPKCHQEIINPLNNPDLLTELSNEDQ